MNYTTNYGGYSNYSPNYRSNYSSNYGPNYSPYGGYGNNQSYSSSNFRSNYGHSTAAQSVPDVRTNTPIGIFPQANRKL